MLAIFCAALLRSSSIGCARGLKISPLTCNICVNITMKTIDINGYSIDIQDKPVSLSFSGGADSALLLYILLANTTETLHVYTFASRLKQFRNALAATRVLTACCSLTGNYHVEHHIVYIDQQSPEAMYPSMRSQLARDGSSCLYTAMTRLPPQSVQEGFCQQLPPQLIDLRNDQTVRPLYYERNTRYTPFINLNKQDIARMYLHLDLRSRLYPLTRSCEGPLGQWDKHCGSCWWCDERAWAFGTLE